MIVDTVAKAQVVEQYVKNSATATGISNLRVDALSAADAVAKGDCIIAVEAPDGAIIVVRQPIVVKGVAFDNAWGVRWVAGSTMTTFKAVFLDLANELVARGEGSVPVYWTQTGTIAKFAAKQLAARTAVDSTGLSYYWFTAKEAISSGAIG